MTPKRRAGGGELGIEGFAVDRVIATGDGTVLLAARDLRDGRAVTLEAPDADRRPDVIDRIAHEARVLAQVGDHPAIVSLYRVDRTRDGRPFLVLEPTDVTPPLSSPALPTEVADVIATGVAMAGALETVHRAGLVHRDVHVGALLRTRYASPVLAQFAATQPIHDGAAGRGLAGVTLAHAAPELCAGFPATPATDVYSLASALFELLTGSPPFGDPAAAGVEMASGLLRIRTEPVPVVHVVGVPAPLAALVARAMAKDPASRPGTALAFGRELQVLQRSLGSEVTPCTVAGEPPIDHAAIAAPRPATGGGWRDRPPAGNGSADEAPMRRSSGPRIVEAPDGRRRAPTASTGPTGPSPVPPPATPRPPSPAPAPTPTPTPTPTSAPPPPARPAPMAAPSVPLAPTPPPAGPAEPRPGPGPGPAPVPPAAPDGVVRRPAPASPPPPVPGPVAERRSGVPAPVVAVVVLLALVALAVTLVLVLR